MRPVWQNELGGLTFEIEGPPRRFVKWAPDNSGIDLMAEATPPGMGVCIHTCPSGPRHGSNDLRAWLATDSLSGENAISDRWKAEPVRAVCAIGRGLRALHEALPVERCPFLWSVDNRLADVQRRPVAGSLNSQRWRWA